MNSLVVQTSFLGDVILTTPLLAELATRGPVTVVVTPTAAPLLAGHPAVTHVVTYDKRGADRGATGFLRLAREVRAEPGDTAYLAQGSHRSGGLAVAAGYRSRIGLATSAGRVWYTSRVPTSPAMHHAERLWRLAGSARAPSEAELRPRLFPSAEDRELAHRLLAAAGAAGGAPLIALAPGSVWATKRWPHFPALAHLLAPLGRIVVIGSEADAPLAREIARSVDGGVVDATGRLPLLASAALIGRCSVLVTNDSAPLHLASAMNTPTVALFGPTVPAFGFGPLAERREIAEVRALPCRPCHAHGPMRCPLEHFRCMRDLLPDHVAAAVARVRRAS